MQIQVNDLNINFQVYGQGSALVIIPGWGDRSDNWYNVAQLLAKNFQVFVLDLPGFGVSDAPPQPWNIDDYTHIVKGFLI